MINPFRLEVERRSGTSPKRSTPTTLFWFEKEIDQLGRSTAFRHLPKKVHADHPFFVWKRKERRSLNEKNRLCKEAFLPFHHFSFYNLNTGYINQQKSKNRKIINYSESYNIIEHTGLIKIWHLYNFCTVFHISVLNVLYIATKHFGEIKKPQSWNNLATIISLLI